MGSNELPQKATNFHCREQTDVLIQDGFISIEFQRNMFQVKKLTKIFKHLEAIVAVRNLGPACN